MNICLKKTIAQIERCLPDNGIAHVGQLRKMYNLTLRLQSQLLSVIYMAFSVVGKWGEKDATIIRILDFDGLQ